MKIGFATLALVTLALSSTLTVGCAADTDGPDAAEEGDVGTDEGEIKSNILGDVAAVKVQGTVLGQSTKVSKVLRLAGLGSRNAKPAEGAFRCMPQYKLEFMDKTGKTVARGGFLCGGGAPSADARGYITLTGGKSYLIGGDAAAIDAVAKEPLVVGDLTWGVTKVQFGKPGRPADDVTATDPVDVARALKALKPSQAPDPHASMPRCLPNHVVTLSRGTAKVAYASFLCGEGGGTDVRGSFSGEGDDAIHGAIHINATEIIAIEEKLRAARR